MATIFRELGLCVLISESTALKFGICNGIINEELLNRIGLKPYLNFYGLPGKFIVVDAYPLLNKFYF